MQQYVCKRGNTGFHRNNEDCQSAEKEIPREGL
jgi:hypothetical protein